ncbi:WD40 repeat domain-containing protein [Anaeromyxobacter oryzisoli]|uniref:hypothetical protein n=1 Tax=Anaeromyxobacter oryzisoli TaxID=2925408 RepID=UPI001F59017B|nr:hypothetical protein [Anaeromyxobacter sp. SG63]
MTPRLRGNRLAGLVWLCLAACSTRDSGAPRAPASVAAAASGTSLVLATMPEKATASAPAPSSPPGLGLHSALPPGPPEIVFAERSGGVAYVVDKGDRFQVVHDGRAGKPYPVVGEIALSADGRRCAHGAIVDGKWRMVVDGVEGRPFDTVRSPVFSPDGSHVAYQAMSGERWHLVVDSTVNRGTRTRYLNHEFGADSARLAFVDDVDDRDQGRLVIGDLGSRKQTVVASGVSAMLLDAGRSRVAAVVTTEGRQRVLTLALDRPDRVLKGPTYDAVSELAFGPDGESIAYVAERSGERRVVLDDREASLGAGHLVGPPVVIPGRKAVGVLLASPDGSVALQELFAERGRGEAPYDEAEGLVYAADGRLHAYAARRGASWFAVLDGKEGPPFDRVVTPVFSPDGRLLAYRARKDGARFVVVAETGGGAVRLHPAYEQVFPVRFTADGSSIAYGVKDGRQLVWKVEPP